MKLVNICLYIYILLKPFYISKSGSLQISDLLILMAFIILLALGKIKIHKKILNNMNYLIIFLMSVVLINTIYYFKYSSNDFIMSTFHYIFVFIGIIVFSTKINDKNFLKKSYYLFIIDIIIQMLIVIIGKGRYYTSTRYMGTFNDPNQFGFFIVMAIMYIYTLENILKIHKRAIYVYVIGLYLIFISSSTGMILAMGTFFAIQLYDIFRKERKRIRTKNTKISRKSLKIFCIIAIVILCIVINNELYTSIKNYITQFSIFERIEEKLNKVKESGMNIIEERGLDKLVNYPQYILFGAGQGNYNRFENTVYKGEIHSTIPSILFSYGIIPTIILMYWIYGNVKGLNLKQMSVYIAILIESFTLLNQRQLLLWTLILLANNYQEKEETNMQLETKKMV